MNGAKAKMESLPPEIIENVCQHFSASDLAKCCAVSRIWREIFGRDRLWRVHCDQALAEVLDDNNSIVEPVFTSPLPDDSTLTSISEWRLNFMKQIRLRNNWSSGNFKMEEIRCRMDEEEFVKSIFFKDRYLLMFTHSELKVWDVNKRPTLKSIFPFHINPGPGGEHLKAFEVKGSDKFVTVDGFVVRVYRLCCVTNKLELLYLFSFELTERCPENTEKRTHELLMRQGGVSKTCTVVGNVFVGIDSNQSPPKMHIWNVETGQKVKEEDCPFNTIRHWRCTRIPSCEKTMSIVLEGEDWNRVMHWYVYSLTRLILFPFHQKHSVSRYRGYHALIFDKYITLSGHEKSRVYNYLTSEIVYTAPCRWGSVLSFRNYIVVKNYITYPVVNPSNPLNNIRPVVWCDGRTESVGNMAIVSFTNSGVGANMSLVFAANKKIDDGSKSVSVPFYYLNDCDKYLINQCGTKLVLIKLAITGNIELKVVHFW